MYLDFSLKKISLLAIIAIVLSSFVYLTHVTKMNHFGTTPYFYALPNGFRYAVDLARAAFVEPVRAPIDEKKAVAIPVLTYHRVLSSEDVNNITVERFREQMTTLKYAGWQAVSLQDFEDFMDGKKALPEKSFLLTFDDGAKKSFYPVDPILKELGYNAVNYIIVQSSKSPDTTYYLTPEEIKQMIATGRWSIGSHSYDGHHSYPVDAQGNPGVFFADLLWKSDVGREETRDEFTARVREDLAHAKRELESTYNMPIRTFAFPLGNETGISGANDFDDGPSITENEARSMYDYGFVQTNNRNYTFNFPSVATDAFASRFPKTIAALKTDFLIHRIHVDYDWDGARLLSIMENGLAKSLPYEDDFSSNDGWLVAWGSSEMGRNNFLLKATPELTSASAYLDGTALWDNYSFETSANWHQSFALILADVVNSKTYHACAFAPGEVRIQKIVNGETTTLKTVKNRAIAYGDDVHMGVRVHGDTIECTWNFASVIEDYSRDFSGGVGVQTWEETPGAAQIQFASLLVRPDTATTTP